MKRKVVYFTRTGTCKRIAAKIADALSIELVQITDNQNWEGFWGYWKAGFFSSTNRKVVIDTKGDLRDADEIILVAPLWAGSIAPAARAFLETYSRGIIHLVVSSNGSQVKDRASFKSVLDIPKSLDNEEKVIGQLIASLSKSGK